ncbi:Fad binding domain protein [Salix suchowensis]|nr:Fad binding domain protein [Salix suchowensis]
MHYALLPTALATLRRCKTFPGDRKLAIVWMRDVFNASVDRRLIRTVPIDCWMGGGYVQGGGHSLMGSKFGMGRPTALHGGYYHHWKVRRSVSCSKRGPILAMSGDEGVPGYAMCWSFPSLTLDLPYHLQMVGSSRLYQEGTPKQPTQEEYRIHSIQKVLPNGSSFPSQQHCHWCQGAHPTFGEQTQFPWNPAQPHHRRIPWILCRYEGCSLRSFAVGIVQFGGRLLPRSLWESKASLAKLESVVRTMIEDDAVIFDIAVSPTKERGGNPKNPELPARRDAERTFYQTLYVIFFPTYIVLLLTQLQPMDGSCTFEHRGIAGE